MSAASFPNDNEPFITSWSGGKDACFAFWQAIQHGARPVAVYTMLDASGERTGSHGLPKEIIQAQAERLGVPVLFRTSAWGQYEQCMKEVVAEAQQQFQASSVVFGDVDLEAHKVWLDRVATEADITPRFPLWQSPRRALVEQTLLAGVRYMIVSVQHQHMDTRFLGQIMTPELADEIAAEGICPTGEDGEFHSLVLDAPCFKAPLQVVVGERYKDGSGHTLLQLSLPNHTSLTP